MSDEEDEKVSVGAVGFSLLNEWTPDSSIDRTHVDPDMFESLLKKYGDIREDNVERALEHDFWYKIARDQNDLADQDFYLNRAFHNPTYSKNLANNTRRKYIGWNRMHELQDTSVISSKHEHDFAPTLTERKDGIRPGYIRFDKDTHLNTLSDGNMEDILQLRMTAKRIYDECYRQDPDYIWGLVVHLESAGIWYLVKDDIPNCTDIYDEVKRIMVILDLESSRGAEFQKSKILETHFGCKATAKQILDDVKEILNELGIKE